MNVVSWTAFIVSTLIIHCHVGCCFKNFALNKSAYQSSTLNYFNFQWTANKAVDNNADGRNPDVSKTCSATMDRFDNHTWEADIGFLIIVKTITVYERTDLDQLSGFKVFIGNTTKPWTGNQPLVETQPVTTPRTFIVNEYLARFVSVIRENSSIMTICEVIVDGECQKGTFGDVCNETCGNCFYGNVSCNTTTGRCKEGCQKGWSGKRCKKVCKVGEYGHGCNETCGMCLNGNNSCSTTDGHCMLGCTAGWKGETCKQECNKGAYGHGCIETCGMCFRGNDSCLTNNGLCQFGCKAGWWGSTCKQECKQGTYSYGCNETCGMCFSGNTSCSSIDGQCNVGCEAGWQGRTCKQECQKGTYGYGCNSTCGMCLNGNTNCSTIDGTCKLGCNAGWRGETCIHSCKVGAYGYGCSETCGMCFGGNNSCSTTDGHCMLGCTAGWQGETCKQECSKGLYGHGCNETCGMCFGGNDCCSTNNRHCQFGCEAGWWKATCKQECEQGTYSYGCNETCGMCFSGNKSCSIVDGHCNADCEAGWQGETCKQACQKGTYGYGCNSTCGMCLNGNTSCSTIDGKCKLGCNAGWRGETCIQEIRVLPSSSENWIIIIGVVVPVVIVIILSIIVLVILRVRRKRSNLSKEVPSMPHQEHAVFQQVIQEGESSDPKTQEIEDTTLPKGSAYQNTERKTRLMAQRIPVLSFWGHVMKMKANKEELESAFHEFSQGLTKKHEEALANPSKNRYKSIYPYDFNRVVLERDSIHGSEYENDSDYINASHIKGFECRKCYIAAQGPINKTVGDFWWMVWQERIECIVMLTNLIEMGKMKCIQYWPDKEEQTYGDVTVKFQGNESFADCIKRDLHLTVSGKSRNITQFHYTAWPDKDVPDTAWSLVEFWKSVRKHSAYGKGPMAVHCSAGVGRTGTFIALDIIYEEASETGHVAVIKCVENLREQRVNMVQTVNQFIFLHDAVAEALGFGTMPVFKKQFPDVLRHLMEPDERSGLIRLQRQYNMLRKLNLEQEESNVPVYSNADGFQSKIIWLPNLSGRDAYIAVKQVDDETLLATIRKRNIKWLIIVDSSSTKTVAGLDITCTKKEDLGAFGRNQFSITSDERIIQVLPIQKDAVVSLFELQKLTMFLLKTWKESNEIPSDSHSVLSLLEDFSQYHPTPSELNPVLLYSRLELNRCSLIYILLNEKDRIRRDGEIHVLRTSAEILGRSRTLLPTFEQYVFIYKCFPSNALQDSTYENTAGIMREIL